MRIYLNMGVKRALRPQEWCQPSYISYKIVYRANNMNIMFQDFCFCIFQNFLCIYCKKSYIQRKHFPEDPRGELYVFRNGRAGRMGIAWLIIQNKLFIFLANPPPPHYYTYINRLQKLLPYAK